MISASGQLRRAAATRLRAAGSMATVTAAKSANEPCVVRVAGQHRLRSSASATDSPVAHENFSFSSYEYPNRKEAPEISFLTAKQAMAAGATGAHGHGHGHSSPSQTLGRHASLRLDDPFDDSGSMSEEEIDVSKSNQKLKAAQLAQSLNSLPITQAVPDFIPPNVPSTELSAPETYISTLSNGVRVVSQETYGQMCTVGVLTDVGSRHESQVGTVQMLDMLAFSSTHDYPDGLRINESLQDWGASRFVNASREQTLHCIDVLRPNSEKAMHLLSQVVLYPIMSVDEVEQCKYALHFQVQESIPELMLGEALQVAAYGSDQQLGRLHFVASNEQVDQLNRDVVYNFWNNNIRHNPKGMVIAGAGIGHEELVELADKYFGEIHINGSNTSAPETIRSVYRGGSHIQPSKPNEMLSATGMVPEEHCRIALAFPVGGWHETDDMVTACVLQTLLGGGSSFSAGGPGKGMYSRMYQQVLNRYAWMETAEAFSAFAAEGGMLGVSGSTKYVQHVKDVVSILAEHLARIAYQPVENIELVRARNMLKCNVLTQLESRLILFEDMGRQLLTYGKREDAATTCRKIDAVTAEDIQKLARRMVQKPPTLAATGVHTEQLPSHEEISSWFRGV